MSRAGTHRAQTFSVIAVSDVHSPRYLLDFTAALARHASDCAKVDAIVFAGDMVEKGKVEALKPILDAVRARCPGKPVIAVFGNEEYIGTEEKYLKLYPEVTWLNDSYTVVEGVAIYGTRGSLDRLTTWQRRNMPWLARVYSERARKLEEEVKRLKREYDRVIVVMHYAPTYATLVGEPPRIWPELGSKRMEEAVRRARPSLVIHGHAHRSQRLEVVIDGVRVVNVAFPARRDLTLIKV